MFFSWLKAQVFSFKDVHPIFVLRESLFNLRVVNSEGGSYGTSSGQI